MYNCVVIDDHSLFNDGLSMILRESGHFNVQAQIFDSEKAYFACLQHAPDLIILDFNMPKMDGLDVVRALKALPTKPKIVVISMYLEKKNVIEFKNLGVVGFFTKTILSEVLIDKLLRIMNEEVIVDIVDLKVKVETDTNDWFSQLNLLTKREKEILKLVKEDLTTQQIADYLHLSFYTVETHRRNINQKLNFNSKAEFYEFLKKIA